MKQRFILFLRAGVFYCEDTSTRKQSSLRTRDETEARNLLHAKNEAVRQPVLNLQMARTYMIAADPAIITRTWQQVMEAIVATKTGSTRTRWEVASKDKAFDLIRNRKLVETTGEQFLEVLRKGSVSTNAYLRPLHNYALGMQWLPWAVLPKRQWPPLQHKEKRAITLAEHQKIIAGERNPELQDYYELLWQLGGAQTDVATLSDANVDWVAKTMCYARMKTGGKAVVHFSDAVTQILKRRPATGLLFPMIAKWNESDRGSVFARRCRLVGVSGVSLHSYRYAWAERAMEAGYPERFAMQALGHTSKAIHRAYARKAQVTLPSLEEYEKQIKAKLVTLPMVEAQRA
jgi:integrase